MRSEVLRFDFNRSVAQRWVSPHFGHSAVVKVMLTEVFHIYSTLLTQPRPFDGDLLGIRNQTGVATFGDSQSIDRKTCLRREPMVEVCSRSIGGNCSLIRELADGLP